MKIVRNITGKLNLEKGKLLLWVTEGGGAM